MTPELKQDLDALFNSTAEQAAIIQKSHGSTPGELEIRLDSSNCECEDKIGQVNTYDHFNNALATTCELLLEEIADAQQKFSETMDELVAATDAAGLDDDVLHILVTKHMTHLKSQITAAIAE
jgi:hypothetical protein